MIVGSAVRFTLPSTPLRRLQSSLSKAGGSPPRLPRRSRSRIWVAWLGDGVADAAVSQSGSYRAGAVALVAQHVGGRTPEGIAGQVNLAGQPAPGASECGTATPPFRAPAAYWWARSTTVESTDISQSTSPAASARACAAWTSSIVQPLPPTQGCGQQRLQQAPGCLPAPGRH